MNMANLCTLWRMHLSVTYQSLRRLVCCTLDHCGGDVVFYHTPHDARWVQKTADACGWVLSYSVLPQKPKLLWLHADEHDKALFPGVDATTSRYASYALGSQTLCVFPSMQTIWRCSHHRQRYWQFMEGVL